jgi:hypothetical protein
MTDKFRTIQIGLESPIPTANNPQPLQPASEKQWESWGKAADFIRTRPYMSISEHIQRDSLLLLLDEAQRLRCELEAVRASQETMPQNFNIRLYTLGGKELSYGDVRFTWVGALSPRSWRYKPMWRTQNEPRHSTVARRRAEKI